MTCMSITVDYLSIGSQLPYYDVQSFTCHAVAALLHTPATALRVAAADGGWLLCSVPVLLSPLLGSDDAPHVVGLGRLALPANIFTCLVTVCGFHVDQPHWMPLSAIGCC